jgi:hypothetical protein
LHHCWGESLYQKEKNTALIEYEFSDEPCLSCGFGIHYADEKMKVIPPMLRSILKQYTLEDPNDYWYGSKESSWENSYKLLKTLIKAFKQDM